MFVVFVCRLLSVGCRVVGVYGVVLFIVGCGLMMLVASVFVKHCCCLSCIMRCLLCIAWRVLFVVK